MRVGDANPEQSTECAEKFGITDLSFFVPLIDFIARGNSPDQTRRLTAGVAGPACNRLVEIDVEYNAADIEQQRVRGARGEQGKAHLRGVRKTGETRNGN